MPPDLFKASKLRHLANCFNLTCLIEALSPGHYLANSLAQAVGRAVTPDTLLEAVSPRSYQSGLGALEAQRCATAEVGNSAFNGTFERRGSELVLFLCPAKQVLPLSLLEVASADKVFVQSANQPASHLMHVIFPLVFVQDLLLLTS